MNLHHIAALMRQRNYHARQATLGFLSAGTSITAAAIVACNATTKNLLTVGPWCLLLGAIAAASFAYWVTQSAKWRAICDRLEAAGVPPEWCR